MPQPLRLEVLNTGTELLLGSVINTHLRLFSDALFPLGLRIQRQVTVPDGDAIRAALEETFGRTDLLLITGGLGPTTDDVTREIVAVTLGLQLQHDEEIWQTIVERFARRSLTMSPRNRQQALRPPESTVLWNPHGTAVGLHLPPLAERGSPHLFLLPGPPRELKPMLHDYVVPIIRKILPPLEAKIMRVHRIAGLGESHVEELVGAELLAVGLELGYCARPGEVDVRTIGTSEQIERAAEILYAHLGKHIISADDRPLEKVVVDRLVERGETLAIAESCTGGGLAHRVTNVSGASAVFMEGFVTYANAAKIRTLGVDPQLIEQHGAVSAPVAAAMAEGARRVAQTDHALSTTGIAGPTGGSEQKPVGTVFIALASRLGATQVVQHRFPTDRETFKNLVTQTALDLLRCSLR